MFQKRFNSENSNSGAVDNDQGPNADEYLSKLAASVLGKESAPQQQDGGMNPPLALTPPPSRPLPKAGRPGMTPSQPAAAAMPQAPRTPAPNPILSTPRGPIGRQITPMPTSQLGIPEWTRRVDFYDAQNNLIPGTMLLFEDGTVGVFKESKPEKDYDIVYMLRHTSEAVPEGIPLYNYEAEPIGRLSPALLEQMIRSGRWDRDMMVFHLLKFKDHLHIPQIDLNTQPTSQQIPSSDRVSKWTVPKIESVPFTPNTHLPPSPPEPEKSAMTRGRRMTIGFGPSKQWDAIFWGKDEMGHVVVHQTHGKWTLMHLDLNRFKDTIVLGDLCDEVTLRAIEKDCAR